ncbi:hypothetical protein ACFFP0_04840 [Rhizobium puerariae]|uniref:PepSY domain-containing protein n=1 Tax=Rhizobium puerariae TaxID=1585791 RepID=A0ABV6AC78_9HYPH
MTSRLMKITFLSAILALPLGAFAQEVTADKQKAILDVLKTMQCEVDPVNIEADDGGFELDDVFCADGQYDMKLNADLTVADKRKE